MERLSIQEALDYCLENPEGLGAQELLDMFPHYREELEPLLGLAREVAEVAPPPVPAPRREAMKARLMAAASAQAATTPVPVSIATRRPVRPLPWFLRPSWVVAAAAMLLITFAWWSAARALPGSPFYNVKLASENVMLNLTSDPAGKATLHTHIANARLYDLRTMQARGSLSEAGPAFDSYSRNITEANNILQGLLPSEARTRVTQAIYRTCVAGKITLDNIAAASISLPPGLRDILQQIELEVQSIENSASQALVTEGIDPDSILGDPDVTPLFTPVAAIPGGTLTPLIPFTAEPTITAGATSTSAPTNTMPALESTSTPSSTSSPTPFHEASETPIPAPPTATQTNTPTVSPTVTATPSSTSSPTSQPARATPTHTPPIKPSDTPTVSTDTATPVPEARSTPTLTATPTPIPTTIIPPTSEPDPTFTAPNTPAPDDTQEPPGPAPDSTSTSLPPPPAPPPASTDTPLPLPTTFVKPSSTPIPPDPSPTQGSEPGTVCDLRVRDVEAECEDDDAPADDDEGCVSWRATVENDSDIEVGADWILELEVRTGSGGFGTVLTETGSDDFGPGDSDIEGTFCYDFSEDARQFRVNFTILTTGYPCQPNSKHSSPEDACEDD